MELCSKKENKMRFGIFDSGVEEYGRIEVSCSDDYINYTLKSVEHPEIVMQLKKNQIEVLFNKLSEMNDSV